MVNLIKVPGSFVPAPQDDGGALSNGVSQTGTITIGDIDGWTFTVNQGDAITVSIGKVAPTATLSPWIRLVSPSGATIGQANGLSAAQINALAQATGTYTVIVGSWDGTFGSNQYAGTGSYVITRR